MLRTTLTAAWSRKRRLVGTALAIVLGVGFLSATLVLGDTARAGFETAFSEANAGTDAYVRSTRELTGGGEPTRPPIDASLVDEVAALDDVVAVSPDVEGTGQVLDEEGEPIGGNGPPTVAAGWIDDPALTGWALGEGDPPAAPDEIVLDRGTAESASVGVGDPLTVLVPEPVEVTVAGIATFGGDDSIGGTTRVAFTMSRAQELLLGSTDLVSGIIVAGADGVPEAALAETISDTLSPQGPGGVEAITGAELTREQQEAIEGDFLGVFTTALTAFALVALLVATFSIFNTFSIMVAQRTRESALLRAIGASRRQVLGAALAESSMVGLVGAVAGAAGGILLASGVLSLMESAGFGLPTDGIEVTAGSMTTAIVAGLVVTLVGGFVPAWRASQVSPLAALRDVAVDTSGSSRARAVGGSIVTAVGAVLMLATAGDSLVVPGIGAATVVVGTIILGPVVARPVAQILGLPLRARGVAGDLARRNATRNPRRTAATATALLVGVGVVSLFTVFGASVSASIETQVDRTFAGDLALRPAGGGFSGAGLSPDAVAGLRELPEVEAATGIGYGAGTVDGRQEGIGFTDHEQLARVADFDVVDGHVGAVGDRGVAMSAGYAADHGYEVGDAVEVGFVDGRTEELRLQATYEEEGIGGNLLVSRSLWASHTAQPSYYLGFVGLADGVPTTEGQAAVESATAGLGGPDVLDRSEFIESQAAQIDALLTVIYGLLAIAVIIALMGIANTISLSVHERTRELGLLRAVGQSRAQLRSMVRWESVIVSTFGALGGLGLGMFLSWGLVRSLNAAEGFGQYAVPLGSLGVILAVGALAGLLAGLRPAWRASRLDVLDAVSAE